MKKVIKLDSIARPINLNNRRDKMAEKSKEIHEKFSYLKQQKTNIFKK
ncbi:hypothetical protein [Bacillus infantis]|nr:hypothetical protein [Bacillus infantis]MCP1161210.1 hypothetical protein [Bacillus infantis]